MVSARGLVPRDMVKLGEAHPRLGGPRDFHRRGPYSLRRSSASLTRPGFRIDEPGLYVSAKLKRVQQVLPRSVVGQRVSCVQSNRGG
jgi:hypothetical protein